MKFDEILEQIGEFGPYQKRINYLLGLPIMLSALQMMSVIFTFSIPSFRCAIPSYPNDTYLVQNEGHAHLINITIPPADSSGGGLYSTCKMYSNLTNIMSDDQYNYNDSLERETQMCNEWVFDQSEFDSTVITEFKLVCGGEIMRSHANMLGFFGGFCGSVIMGIIADVLGRKIAIIAAVILYIIFSLVTVLATSFYVVMAIRFIGGIATHTLFAIACTTVIELVGPNKRSFTGTLAQVFWSTGVLLLLPIAYFIPDWRYMQVVFGCFCILLLSLWWLIPESPRWLLDKGRYKEVEDILLKICRSNNTELPAGVVGEDTKDEAPKVPLKGMFTSRVLLLRVLIIFINWFAVNLFYYGVSLNVTNLEGSPYLNYLLQAVIELASYLFVFLVINRIGRRTLHFTSITVGSLACLAVIPVVLTGGSDWQVNILALIGKFCASMCYCMLYIMSAELFPTVLRNSGIGFCSIFENIGGICAPYIADLGVLVEGPIGKGLSLVVFGVVGLIAGGLTLFLPETLHRELPETIQDAIDFDKQKPKNPPKKGKNRYEMTPVTDNQKV